jgi:hypothetical protein
VAWECAECNVKEDLGTPIDAVCHHCGKLLCRKHRVEIADHAFSAAPGPMGRTAVHCRACKRRYHPADIPLAKTPPLARTAL